MSTRRFSLLTGHELPDDSGDVYPDNFANHSTNDEWKHGVWAFKLDASNVNYLHGSRSVPKGYNSSGTTKIIVIWTAAATSGDVQWDFDYRSVGGNDTESLDQSGTQESVTVNDNAPSAAFRRLETEMSLTASNLAADDTLEWRLGRDGPSESSGMTDEALIEDLILECDIS